MIDTELSSIFKSCADAIRSKTGDVSATYTPYELSTGIGNIETNLQPIQDDWYLPKGWFDLRTIYNDDIAQSVGKVAYLIRVNEDGTVPTYGYQSGSIPLSNYGYFSFGNDGNYILSARTSNEPDKLIKITNANRNIFKVDWDKDKYIANPYNDEKYVWIEAYYSLSSVQSTWLATAKNGVIWVCGDEKLNNNIFANGRFARDLVAITGFKTMGTTSKNAIYQFECAPLETVPPLYYPNATDMKYSFNNTALKQINWAENGKPVNCKDYTAFITTNIGLTEFPDILPKDNQVTSVYNIMGSCATIRDYPDIMDFSNIRYYPQHFWNHCNYLRQYIRHLPQIEFDFPSLSANNLSCTFNSIAGISPTTIARFDNEDNLSGGWLYCWNKHPADSQISVKFLQMPSWFNDKQKSSVINHLKSKGIILI